MNDNHNIPAIRFSVFSDEWVEIQLGDAVERYKELIETPKGGYWRLGVRSHAKGTFLSYVAAGKQLEEKELSKVVANALIVNIVFAWEHAAAITTAEDTKALVSHRFPQFIFHNDMVSAFFKYAILDERFRYHLWLSSPSGAGRNKTLSINDMLCYQMNIPKLMSEQEKIGMYFNTLDKRIELAKAKYQKLLSIKQFILDSMFPKDGKTVPEIRFAEFTDDWEQRKFREIYEVNNERNEGRYPVKKTLSIATMTFNEQGSGAGISALLKYKVLRVGDVAFEGHTNKEFRYGRFVLNNLENGIMSPRFTTLRPTIPQEYDFWEYYIHSEEIMRSKLINATKAGTMMNELVPEDLFRQSILVPSLDEQRIIGVYLKQLDNLITLHQRRGEKLQNIKLACLEKMFVPREVRKIDF